MMHQNDDDPATPEVSEKDPLPPVPDAPVPARLQRLAEQLECVLARRLRAATPDDSCD